MSSLRRTRNSSVPWQGRTGRLAGLRSVPLDGLGAYDAALVVTDHDAVDWQSLVDGSRLVVDTRNATRGVTHNAGRIVRA